ncbi:MAG: hypothetical protein RBT63_01805 [Bdellovibrionales bacterium]|nr:hypothetical protein [Bdellovibrionales bacterium]
MSNRDPQSNRRSLKETSRTLWTRLHICTLGLIGLLLVGNIASFLRPFESYQTPTKNSDAPSVPIKIAEVRSGVREPAEALADTPDSGPTPYSSKEAKLLEVHVGCSLALEVKAEKDVRQIRLEFASCNNSVTAVRNTTNGFEATLFQTAPDAERLPATKDPIATSTDYI